MKKVMVALLVSLFMLGGATAARATVLPLDASFVPNYGPGGISSPLDSTGWLNYYVPDSSLTGTIRQSVYKNKLGLLFAFDITNDASPTGTSRANISTLNTADFEDLYFVKAGYSGATTSNGPDGADIDEGTITFNWMSDKISRGETVPRLFIQTSAQEYKAGSFSLQGTFANGMAQSQNFNGFSPVPTPEPATVVLLGSGLLGLFGLRRKEQA